MCKLYSITTNQAAIIAPDHKFSVRKRELSFTMARLALIVNEVVENSRQARALL